MQAEVGLEIIEISLKNILSACLLVGESSVAVNAQGLIC